MATVKITPAIIEHVRGEIQKLYKSRIDKLTEEAESCGIGDRLYDLRVPRDVQSLMRRIEELQPGVWFERSETIKGVTSISLDSGGSKTVYLLFKLSENKPVFPGIGRYASAMGVPSDLPEFSTLREITIQISELERERDKLSDMLVNGVLEKCTTLKQVLEFWPTALDFMPDKVKERHSQQTAQSKSRAKQAEIKIDDETKATLIKARMLVK